MCCLTHSRFGGFLLHRGWFRLTLTRKARAFLSTGCNAVSPRQYIHRADDIGVVGVSTVHTLELGLCLPILSCHMPTSGTRLARVVRRDWNEYPAIPVELVFQLSPELEPALIENGPVQPRLLRYVFPRLLGISFARLGHIPNLQVLDRHHRVVFTDGGRALMQEVAPGIANAGVDVLHSPFGFLPVLAEFDFAAHGSLVALEPYFVLFETVERSHKAAIAQRSETGNTHVDTDCTGGVRNALFDLALGLDTGVPLASGLADGDVLGNSKNVSAVAIPHPTQFGQLDTSVGLVYFKALRKPQTFSRAFAFEAGEVCAFFKEVFIRTLQVFERMLQGLRGGLFEPREFPFPRRKKVCHCHIPNELATCLVVGFLQGKRLVVDEPTRPCVAAHIAHLFAVGHEFIFKGLEPLHGLNYTLVYERQSKRKQRNSPRQALCIPYARSLGLCDKVPTRSVHQGDFGRSAQHLHQCVRGLRIRVGGVRWGGRPCSFAGQLSAQGFCIGSGKQLEGRFQSNDSAEKLPQHSQETLGGGALVTKLLRGQLRWCAHRRHTPVHRTTADAALGDSSAVRALHPRPKGRGFPRKMDKPVHKTSL